MSHSGPPQGSRMPSMTYPERLRTFQDFWDDNEATARQLAAIGHVYDRPPLEALEEGSRCISCSQFVQRVWSVWILEGPMRSPNNRVDRFEGFQFHHTGCIHMQVRIPLEAQAVFTPFPPSGDGCVDPKDRWRASRIPPQATDRQQQVQTSLLFALPVELRLQIYAMVLPQLDDITEISTLKEDSTQIAANVGSRETTPHSRPQDFTKLNLLRTCKALHSETLDSLYATPTFTFDTSKTLYLFLRHIGARGRAVLGSVNIACGSREDAIALSLLATCHNLQRITVRLRRARLVFPRASLWVVDGVAALLALRGLREVRFGNGSGCIAFVCAYGELARCGPGLVGKGHVDAAVVTREIQRPRGEAGGVRWVDGYMDI
ncbi:hypothetical protein LTR01_008447 [Friedmanniomyces endolithicus]|nr:hypothetical protein LTR01_008447 [Friedmanniomyces endolithicus]